MKHDVYYIPLVRSSITKCYEASNNEKLTSDRDRLLTGPPRTVGVTLTLAGSNLISYIDIRARGHEGMNNRQRKTLEAIFHDPVRADIRWADIESMLLAAGAEISEGAGSRVRISLGNARAVFHRPHPRPITDKGSVRAMRRFLEVAGVTPR